MTTPKNDFAAYMTATNHNLKQVKMAGEKIGISQKTAQKCFQGNRELTKTERLAISAIRSNLPEWTPENDEEISSTADLVEAIRKTKSPA